MDVSPSRPPQRTDAAARESVPPARAAETRPATPDEGAAARHPGPLSDAPWVPHSTLKSTITAADVDARIEIQEGTSRVTVTMYNRETGEVLRTIPAHQVHDVDAAVTGRGLSVDASS